MHRIRILEYARRRAMPSCCRLLLIIGSIGITLACLAWREFRGMLVYDLYRRGVWTGGTLGWARVDADDCVGTAEPRWPRVDVLASFWALHPCMSGNASCSSLTTAGAGQSTLYPLIWDAGRANHEASARRLNVTYLVGGADTPEFYGPGMHALCEKIRYLRGVLRTRVAEGRQSPRPGVPSHPRCSKARRAHRCI